MRTLFPAKEKAQRQDGILYELSIELEGVVFLIRGITKGIVGRWVGNWAGRGKWGEA